MSIKYHKGSQSLAIDDKIISLPGPIWSVFEYKNRVFVTLAPEYGLRNVFCYSKDGQLLWTIQPHNYHKFKEGNEGYSGVYIGDVKELSGKLIAVCRGFPFYLDINTGNVQVVSEDMER